MSTGSNRLIGRPRGGERWTSVSDEPDSLRPGIEDLIEAGAIVSALSDLRASPEAEIAAAGFAAIEHRIIGVLQSCVSGRELIDKGFRQDVDLVAAIDSTNAVPSWRTSNPVREFTARTIQEKLTRSTRQPRH